MQCCRLSELTKRMFNELGSAVVQNVKFRDAWAFVSQKGIQGFTEIEQVRLSCRRHWCSCKPRTRRGWQREKQGTEGAPKLQDVKMTTKL